MIARRKRTVSLAAAKSLAVRYDAYNSACNAGDDNGIIVWGSALIESLDETGIVLGSRDVIQSLISYAKARQQKAAA